MGAVTTVRPPEAEETPASTPGRAKLLPADTRLRTMAANNSTVEEAPVTVSGCCGKPKRCNCGNIPRFHLSTPEARRRFRRNKSKRNRRKRGKKRLQRDPVHCGACRVDWRDPTDTDRRRRLTSMLKRLGDL